MIWEAARSISRSWNLNNGVFQVLATNGNTRLGGDDLDTRLVRLSAREDLTPRADPV
jgi:molecular chaperone DnaK (HSP70)